MSMIYQGGDLHLQVDNDVLGCCQGNNECQLTVKVEIYTSK